MQIFAPHFCVVRNLCIPFLFIICLFTSKTIHAQNPDCTFGLDLIVSNADCGPTSGSVAINPTGPNVGNLEEVKHYQVYLKGSSPSDEWKSSNVIDNLSAGTYIAHVKAICNIGKEEVFATKEFTVIYNPYESLQFTISSEYNKNPNYTLSCYPTGQVQLLTFIGSKPPYAVKMTYDNGSVKKDSIVYQHPLYRPNTVIIPNLPAGKYTFTFSDGCENSVAHEIEIKNLDSDIPPVLFDQTIKSSTTQQKGDEYGNCYGIRYLTPDYSFTPYAYYWSDKSTYYEFALRNKGQSDESLVWETLNLAGNSGLYYQTGVSEHTLSDMREDNTLIPEILVRVKPRNGETSCESKSQGSFRTIPSRLRIGQRNVDCGKRLVVADIIESDLVCYPATFEFWKGGELIESVESNYNSTSIVISDPGSYLVKVIDSEGYNVAENTFLYTLDYQNRIRLNSEILRFSCNVDTFVIYAYSHLDTPIQGSLIEFNRDKTNPAIPSPPDHNLRIVVPKDYNGNVYPFSDDYSVAGTNFSKSLIPPGGAYVYFNITDSCGYAKLDSTFLNPNNLVSTKYYFEDITGLPVTRTEMACDTATLYLDKEVLGKLVKKYNDGVDAGYSTAYLKIGADSVGGSGYVYHSGNVQVSSLEANPYIRINRSGRYRVTVGNLTFSGGNALRCEKVFNIYITLPELELNRDKTTAYRCKSGVGNGYIYVEAKNGSGNYEYTLYGASGPDAIAGPNTTGIFLEWANDPGDEFKVRVKDLNCNREMTQSISVYTLDNIVVVDGGPRKCVGDQLIIRSVPLGESSLEWRFGTRDGAVISTEKNVVIEDITTSHSGMYYVKVGVLGCDNEYAYDSVFISVADKVMYWKSDASDHNWHNPANWNIVDKNKNAISANAVPAPCTTVHLVGNAANFPSLDNVNTPRVVDGRDYGLPACDTIIYHYGSETYYPHYLQYTAAQVQYNMSFYNNGNDFTAYEPDADPDQDWDISNYPTTSPITDVPKITRAEWHLLSTPLKNIISGDFMLGGQPYIYQMLYNGNATQPEQPAYDEFTIPFNSLVVPLDETAHALALWVSDYDEYLGMFDHKNLEALKGIIQIPYFLDKYQMDVRKELYSFSVEDSTSHFKYFFADRHPIEVNPRKTDSYVRNYQSFRFLFEDNNNKLVYQQVNGVSTPVYNLLLPARGSSGNKKVMIGNPLMCHIDFDKLYENNSSVIQGWYYLPVIQQAEDDGPNVITYEQYVIGAGVGVLTQDIPPLQGFIVELIDNPVENKLLLPLEGQLSVVSGEFPQNKSKSKKNNLYRNSAENGWLSIEAVTPSVGISNTSYLLFNRDFVSVPKIVFPEDLERKAEVFFMDSLKYLNAAQVENDKPAEILFGLQSLYDGDINLKITNTDPEVESMRLIDLVANQSPPFESDLEYTFRHRTGRIEKGQEGLDTERFKLQIKYKEKITTGKPEYAGFMEVYMNHKQLNILSDNLIEEVKIIDTLGQLIFSETSIRSANYRRELPLHTGVYLVHIKVEDGKSITRKVLIQ